MNQNMLKFECVGMADGGKFPLDNTGRGKNLSPQFIIKNLSPNAKTLIITLEDLSHPIKNFTHWIIWNIPATNTIAGAIPAGKVVPTIEGAIQGIGYGFHRYAGPKPPKSKSHRYGFTIYALDCSLSLKASSTKKKVLNKASKHIIQFGNVCGYFE